MKELTATATEMQNNFGKYLNLVMNGDEVIVTKNGKVVGRLIPDEKAKAYLTDSLTGIMRDFVEKDIREKDLKKKYGIDD